VIAVVGVAAIDDGNDQQAIGIVAKITTLSSWACPCSFDVSNAAYLRLLVNVSNSAKLGCTLVYDVECSETKSSIWYNIFPLTSGHWLEASMSSPVCAGKEDSYLQ